MGRQNIIKLNHKITSAGFPVINDPLYNHEVFGTNKGKGGHIGKSDDQLIQDLIAIHNAENWSVSYIKLHKYDFVWSSIES